MQVFLQVNSFQRDFKWAISAWLEMGIRQKMEKDIKTSPKFRGNFEEAFWSQANVLSNETLGIDHILPCIVLLAVGLFLAIMAIVQEFILACKAKRTKNKRNVDTTDKSHVDSGTNPEDSKVESANLSLSIRDNYGRTLKPNKITKPDMESGEEREHKIFRDKGDHHTISVMAEIHDALPKEQYSMEGYRDENYSVLSSKRITPKLDNINRISPNEIVAKRLSREGSSIGKSPQWSEIIEFLDNESYTPRSFLDETTFSNPLISIISPSNQSNHTEGKSGSLNSQQWYEIIEALDNELQQEDEND